MTELNFFKTKVSLDDFTPMLKAASLDADGNTSIPDGMAQTLIRNSAIEFARRTQILKSNITVDLQCGLSTYPLETDDCEKVIAVTHAQYDNWTDEDCGSYWSFGDVQFRLEDGVLKIHPAPSSDVLQGLQLTVVTVPARDACEVDSRLFDEWSDAIVEGAMSKLYAMPQRPWSSMSRSDYSRRLFNEAVGMATVTRVMDGRRGALKMSLNRNWSPRFTRQSGW